MRRRCRWEHSKKSKNLLDLGNHCAKKWPRTIMKCLKMKIKYNLSYRTAKATKWRWPCSRLSAGKKAPSQPTKKKLKKVGAYLSKKLQMRAAKTTAVIALSRPYWRRRSKSHSSRKRRKSNLL